MQNVTGFYYILSTTSKKRNISFFKLYFLIAMGDLTHFLQNNTLYLICPSEDISFTLYKQFSIFGILTPPKNKKHLSFFNLQGCPPWGPHQDLQNPKSTNQPFTADSWVMDKAGAGLIAAMGCFDNYVQMQKESSSSFMYALNAAVFCHNNHIISQDHAVNKHQDPPALQSSSWMTYKSPLAIIT